MNVSELRKELKRHSSRERAKNLMWFFKTGPGEYGHGDIFIGLKVPDIRKTAKKFTGLSLKDIATVLSSRIHEERLAALLIMVSKYAAGDDPMKKDVFDMYLRNTRYINNWDLVDLSSHHIVGDFLLDKPRQILYDMAGSSLIWDRRIAIVSTARFIKNGYFDDTLKISALLLGDREDLIHKAAGWMLREVGKKNLPVLEGFLKKHYMKMPRTMLRYAIERFPEKRRQEYLKGKV